jgi:hypothetical protein
MQRVRLAQATVAIGGGLTGANSSTQTGEKMHRKACVNPTIPRAHTKKVHDSGIDSGTEANRRHDRLLVTSAASRIRFAQ